MFDDLWIKRIHCILWRVKRVNQWVLHRMIYELYREGVLRINSWQWMGDWPRSAEVDGVLALLNMIGAIDFSDDTIIAVKPPLGRCSGDSIVEKAVNKLKHIR